MCNLKPGGCYDEQTAEVLAVMLLSDFGFLLSVAVRSTNQTIKHLQFPAGKRGHVRTPQPEVAKDEVQSRLQTPRKRAHQPASALCVPKNSSGWCDY